MADPVRILAVIPARGGSKGIPLKNLAPLGGQSLLARTLEMALAVPEFSAVCVSTDHPQIKEVAEAHDGVVTIDRPYELAGGRVADAPVLRHAVLEMEALQQRSFDYVVMLQVTSPLRDRHDINSCLELIASSGCDAVWTVSPTDLHYHPLKQLVIGEGSQLSFYENKGMEIVARQQLEPVFHRNGCCYVVRRDHLVNTNTTFSSGNTLAVVSDGVRLSIDTEDDLVVAERLLKSSER